MSDPTTETLRKTMQAIVSAAPEAPDIDTAKIPTTSRRTSPVLVMAGAFAFVLLLGAVTSLFVLGDDRGTVPSGGAAGDTATSTSVMPAEPTLYDALPTTWDAVVVLDVGAMDSAPGDIARFVSEAGEVPGVGAVSVVSPDDVATALGWDDGLGGGIFIVTSGDAAAAEQAALLAPDGWMIVLSAERRKIAMQEAMDALTRYAERVTDQLSLGRYSGPEPAFDPAELGDEMPLENAYDGSETLPQVPDAIGELSDTIVYIGTISDVDGFVYGVDTDGGTTEICQAASWWLIDSSFTSCFDGSETELSKSIGMASGPEDGIVVAVTALDDEVSIVGIELPSGQRYWQRPVAGSAMFVTNDPGVLVSITITTYDAKGNPLTTELYNPNA